jgi:hypothetical protein
VCVHAQQVIYNQLEDNDVEPMTYCMWHSAGGGHLETDRYMYAKQLIPALLSNVVLQLYFIDAITCITCLESAYIICMLQFK